MLFLGGLTYGEVLVIMRLSFAHSLLRAQKEKTVGV